MFMEFWFRLTSNAKNTMAANGFVLYNSEKRALLNFIKLLLMRLCRNYFLKESNF